MSGDADNTVSISILGKEYLVSCPPDARGELFAAARDLDRRMREVKASGKVFGLERIAVMAALNLSHELLQANQENQKLKQASERLSQQIEQTLTRTEQPRD